MNERETESLQPTQAALETTLAAGALVVSRTARALAEASIATNTRAAYASALRRLDDWLAGRTATDETLAGYLSELFDAGKASASASMVVAAVRFRARLSGLESPTGPATERVLAGFRRQATGRGRGQAKPCTADNLAAILATASLPRTNGRGTESDETARARGLEDSAIAALLFQGGLRRSEVAALRWSDVEAASDDFGLLVTVRTSKTNQDGDDVDIRYLKNGAAAALRKLREHRSPDDSDLVFDGLSAQSIGNRFGAAATAAGIEPRLTAHSGRVGLASELTARGSSTTETRTRWFPGAAPGPRPVRPAYPSRSGLLSPAGGVPSPSLRFSGSGAWLSQQDVFFLGLVLFLEGLSTDPPCILLVLLLLALYYMSVRVFGIKK